MGLRDIIRDISNLTVPGNIDRTVQSHVEAVQSRVGALQSRVESFLQPINGSGPQLFLLPQVLSPRLHSLQLLPLRIPPSASSLATTGATSSNGLMTSKLSSARETSTRRWHLPKLASQKWSKLHSKILNALWNTTSRR